MSETAIKFHRVISLPVSGTLGHVYFNTATKSIYVWNGSEFELYCGNIVTELDDDCTDVDIPSAKCVYEVISDNEEVTAAALNTLNTGKINEPATEGSSGQVLTTNGSGTRTWSTPLTLSTSITSNGTTLTLQQWIDRISSITVDE